MKKEEEKRRALRAPVEEERNGRGRISILPCWERMQRSGGWRMPRKVERLIVERDAGTVLHFFGGRARFGTRMDIDPIVEPDVLADAWAPPFERDSFDTVILDPPYIAINGTVKQALFRSAAWIARRRVWWFHTLLVSGSGGLKLEHTWLVVVGHSCFIRALQMFTPGQPKREPHPYVGRGPGVKYNRWRMQPQGLPFDVAP